MSLIVSSAKEQLSKALEAAIKSAMSSGELMEAEMPRFAFEVPADKTHGDLSCNVAMASAKLFRSAPIKTANAIVENIYLDGTYFSKCEVAGPGFLNFFYSDKFYGDVLKNVLELDAEYGKSNYGNGKKVMVEFVSANPTGEMHIGNARGGALGDCLASVLDEAGYKAYREFYVNDAGNQLQKFGMSLEIRYLQIVDRDNAPELPEDSYHGQDIINLATAYADEFGDSLLAKSEEERREALVAFGMPKLIEKMKNALLRYGIEYDNWFYESELHNSGAVEKVIELFKSKGLTYEKDGALWYKASEFGGEKDEVIVRSNGYPTYFTADIAYHLNKFERGFDLLIDCWGADHHGHVARMKGAMDAVGKSADDLEIVLYQLVNLVRNGEVVRMSKRTGKAILLEDLLDEVSLDAARFTFNLHEPNMAMDFDLDLAVAEDSQNPVYYVQYAHARICSILRNLESEGITPRACTDEELALLKSPEELELLRYISAYTDEVIRSAKQLDSSIITKYVINLATLFHKFYNSCRVKGEDEGIMQARLNLCVATKITIRNVLNLMKVSVPESM